jgi:hypothetical protein
MPFKWIPSKLWTRKCNGCAIEEYHNAHLTFLGSMALYTFPWRRERAE